MKTGCFRILLFASVSHVLKAEKILKDEGIPCKLIPIPKHVDPDCGVCLRFSPQFGARIARALSGKVEITGEHDV